MDKVYHRRDFIITVITVFLALGIGILIGASLSDNIIVKQQQEIVEIMEAELNKAENMYGLLEEKNILLNNKLVCWEAFQEDFLPALINNLLEGLKVVLIYGGSHDDSIIETIEYLELAGADTYTACVNVEELGKHVYIEVYGEKYSLNNSHDRSIFLNLMSEGIINHVIKGEDSDLISFFKENGFIEFRGSRPDCLDKVIYIMGSMTVFETANIDKLFLSLLNESELEVIGVSLLPEEIKLDYLEENRILSVNNVDNIHGKLLLINMLQGHTK